MIESLRALCRRSTLLVSANRGVRFGLEHYKAATRAQRWRRARTGVIKSYLGSHSVCKLQVGSRDNILPDWLNTDLEPVDDRVVFLDARELFPFADETLDYIFSEHTLEHLTYSEGVFCLRECHRILKPGGRMRIATPDLNKILGLCARARSETQERYIQRSIDRHFPELGLNAPSLVVNNFFQSWGHRFIYDADTLEMAVKGAGFCDLRWFTPGESEDANLRGLEAHDRVIGDDMNRFETMIAEAARI
jgi:predicted SAM-dependent methyltransferase